MRSLYFRLSIVTIVIFIIGIVLAGFLMYSLPERLVEGSTALDLLNIKQITPLLNETFLVTGAVLITGLISVILLLISSSGANEAQVVYVDKSSNQQGQNTYDENEESDEEREGHHQFGPIKELMQKDLSKDKLGERMLSLVCKELEAVRGAIFYTQEDEGRKVIKLAAAFAYAVSDYEEVKYSFGEGITGQVAKDGELVNVKNIPEGYIQVLSGLGASSPASLVIVPFKQNNEVIGVAEIAGFKQYKKADEEYLKEAFDLLASKVATDNK